MASRSLPTAPDETKLAAAGIQGPLSAGPGRRPFLIKPLQRDDRTTVINNNAAGGDSGGAGAPLFRPGGGIFVRSNSALNLTIARWINSAPRADTMAIRVRASGGGICRSERDQ